MSDYDSVVRILNQGQALHINWRPDIYKPNDALLPKAVFEEIVKGDTFYIAENEGNVIGILELIFRHIESPAQVTRDIVFIDTMAVDEPYRGMGVGHLFFEKVKEIKAKIEATIPGIAVREVPNKLICTHNGHFVKVEVNDVKRGIIAPPVELPLCDLAPRRFRCILQSPHRTAVTTL